MKILFFAARDVQRAYFDRLAAHIGEDARVCWYKRCWFPGPGGLRSLPLAGLGEVLEVKAREKRNARGRAVSRSYLLAKGMQAAWLFLVYRRVLKKSGVSLVGLWNGYKFRQALVVRAARTLGIRVAYFENGLLPGTSTLDFAGINAANSLPRQRSFYDYYDSGDTHDLPLNLIERKPDVPVAAMPDDRSDDQPDLPPRFIFVPLQVNTDSQITVHSPWVADMAHLFDLISRVKESMNDQGVSFVFKKHPSCPGSYELLYRKAAGDSRLVFANNSNTQMLIEKAEAVITINSTVGIEAVLLGRKVVTLGEAFYSIDGLCLHAASESRLLEAVNHLSGWSPDEALRKRFLAYVYREYAVPGNWQQADAQHLASAGKRLMALPERRASAVFMVSTPLNLYVALGIALQRSEEMDCHLVFIDQKPQGQRYIDAIKGWAETPFADVMVLHARSPHGGKLSARLHGFAMLDGLLQRTDPQQVYVGNDRRIEFQYLMHRSQSLYGHRPRGCYMDDGTFTYVGRKFKSGLERKLDVVIKHLIYGRWCESPDTVGASSWIDDVHVSYPEHIHALLKGKQIKSLDSRAFMNERVRRFSSSVLNEYGVDADAFSGLDVVITLPHESLMDKDRDYRDNMRSLVDVLVTAGRRVGVKYHPRQTGGDALGLCEYDGVILIPAGIAFEVILPLLDRPLIVGDVSTTLLTARWLRPDLKVISVDNPRAGFHGDFAGLFDQLDVRTVKTTQELEALV